MVRAVIAASDIVELYRERKNNRASVLNRAEQVKRAYNGELVMPVTELPIYGRDEAAAVANLLCLGIDQTAMRIASTMPTFFSPPVRPGIKQSEERGEARRRAAQGWTYDNEYEIKTARRARHMIAWTASPVMIRPWKQKGIPRWRIFDPLCTFAAPQSDLDGMEPEDCIFSFQRSLKWLQANYPLEAMRLYKGSKPKGDDKFDLLEYVDDSEHVMVAVGKSREGVYNVDTSYGTEPLVELERFENRAHVCTAVVPARVTLDKPLGQFDHALGIYKKQARLAALEEIGIERGVFPEQWLVADGAGRAQIITQADAAEGIIGETQGGKIETVQYQPGYKTDQAIDRYERYIRIDSRTPAEMSGESASNVRTDRRGNTILSATVDFTIGEAQKLLARSGEKEMSRAIAVAKGYFGSQRRTFYVGWTGTPGDYTPDKDFDSDVVFVRYSLPGSDVNGLAVAAGQRMGLSTMSARTFMELDPLIDDPDLEQERVIAEQLDRGILAEFMQPGAATIVDKARVRQLVAAQDMDLADAVMQAQKEAQERQSSTVNPAEPGSPDAQPGMAPPGAGAEAGVAPPAVQPSTQDIATRLRALQHAGTSPQVTNVPTSPMAVA